MIETAILCMALNIYHEARGEPVPGQHTVAQVTMNRAERNPANVCDVVFKPKQFSWANPLTDADPLTREQLAARYIPKDENAWYIAKQISRWTVTGYIPDFTNGATHYHAVRVNPYWAKHKKPLMRVGQHQFYRKH